MPKRKSTREHLLNTGAMIVGESGLRALTIRGLSLRAGTNTGSFVYHFGNREAFLNELLERWYEPLFTGVRTHANIHLPAFEKLEAILEDVMEFLLRHGQFIAQLVLDALAGERAAIRFISGIHTRHPLVLLETIREAQEEGSVLQGDPMNILIYLVCCGGAPFILSGQLQVHDPNAVRPVLDLLGSILNDPGKRQAAHDLGAPRHPPVLRTHRTPEIPRCAALFLQSWSAAGFAGHGLSLTASNGGGGADGAAEAEDCDDASHCDTCPCRGHAGPPRRWQPRRPAHPRRWRRPRQASRCCFRNCPSCRTASGKETARPREGARGI